MLNLTMPGNPRYQPFKLREYFGYDNLYRTVAEVEIANLEVMGELGIIPRSAMRTLTPRRREKLLTIDTTEVDEVERKITKHDIRAWVRIAQEIIGKKLAPWLHVMLTSYDAIDTARTLQYIHSYQGAVRPSVEEIIAIMADLVRKFADQPQIGRTHGQAALPITVGFWLATILNRFIYNHIQMAGFNNGLVGKISGAVGAHNAQFGLGITKRCERTSYNNNVSYEERVLARLGLSPAPISTQILPPEPLAYFLFSCCALSAAFGQFGRDCRHLMRSEIGEIAEAKDPGSVGSSTMAGKQNPIIFEGLEGFWQKNIAEFLKVQLTMISEHQRDLTGSGPMRDFPIIIINLQAQMDTLLRQDKKGVPFLSRLVVNSSACQANLHRVAHIVLGEPIYIALQMAGYTGDAHRLINDEIAPIARETGGLLIDILENKAYADQELTEALSRIPKNVIELFRAPGTYTGDAREKALEIASKAEGILLIPD